MSVPHLAFITDVLLHYLIIEHGAMSHKLDRSGKENPHFTPDLKGSMTTKGAILMAVRHELNERLRRGRLSLPVFRKLIGFSYVAHSFAASSPTYIFRLFSHYDTHVMAFLQEHLPDMSPQFVN